MLSMMKYVKWFFYVVCLFGILFCLLDNYLRVGVVFQLGDIFHHETLVLVLSLFFIWLGCLNLSEVLRKKNFLCCRKGEYERNE